MVNLLCYVAARALHFSAFIIYSAWFAEWMLGISIPRDVYWMYMIQMGFYVHCIYASVFLETIRKDFVLLMTHHFLTIGLLSYSYGVR